VKRRDKTEIRHANVGLSILVSVTQSQTIHATYTHSVTGWISLSEYPKGHIYKKIAENIVSTKQSINQLIENTSAQK
jgi:Ni,Fe-hydrogenase I cytochrome b subunit